MGNSQYKKLGIMGGLGPAATATLFGRIIDLTEAATDQDHLDITILNRPQTPDRTAYILGKSDESYIGPLHDSALTLEGLGCQLLALPCVTGHHRSEEWSAGLTTAEVVHMPRETARYLARAGKRHIGIMATDGTGRARVLQDAFEAEGLQVTLPDAENQAKVMSIIYDDVKRGRRANMRAFDEVCAHLREAGCDAVVLGCTELSVINAPAKSHGMVVVDAMEVLAIRCVQECGAPVRWDNTVLENVYE